MNSRCTICDAVISGISGDRCPECGAREIFLKRTTEAPRHAKGTTGTNLPQAWEFSPDGPVLRRIK